LHHKNHVDFYPLRENFLFGEFSPSLLFTFRDTKNEKDVSLNLSQNKKKKNQNK